MFAQRLDDAIATAPLSGLESLSCAIWKAYAAGSIADADAQCLAERIHARRSQARTEAHTARPVAQPGRPSIFPPKRLQRSPDRAKSMERRRTLAASGVMPPSLACRFTTGELAVLRIVADAATANGGQCVLPVDAIAARAGVCRRTAQNAIRSAAREGLLTVQERRRRGQRNDFNIVRIVAREWLLWLSKGGGCKKPRPTDTRFRNRWKMGVGEASRPRRANQDCGMLASTKPRFWFHE